MPRHLLRSCIAPLFAFTPLVAITTAMADEPRATAERLEVQPIHETTVNYATRSNVRAESSDDASKVLDDAEPIEGVIRTYRPHEKLIGEFQSSDYSDEYIVLMSIARGIGQDPLLGGMSWGFGDDMIWKFRKIGKRVHLIRRNVRFRANKNTPEASAVANAYSDSVLYSLPILGKGPKGGDLVDLTQVFMSDLPQISQVLSGFSFSAAKSTWESVKGFERNLEIEVAATYASNGRSQIDSVADSRGVTINVHYSISKIPQSDYQPRLADDRVGYFLTVVKDYSQASDDEQFVRYINRWNLKKADPDAELSVPKKPIIFWIENTVPFRYRKPIHDGIAEWNRAFEQAGFLNAIEVRQQPDNAEWEPEDINYNTFRWITSSAGFAMGPSRVNPYTGEILDADIIFDADFLDSWNSKFETFGPDAVEALTGGPLEVDAYEHLRNQRGRLGGLPNQTCRLNHGLRVPMAFSMAAIQAAAEAKVDAKELRERLIMEGLKEVTMHEVGHTLGLRHNFKASTYLTLEEAADRDRTSKEGLAASVMDYLPPNIVAEGETQGEFYSQTVGVYDRWAIEYGYKPLSGSTQSEKKELDKIAARSGQPGLAFSTDENTRSYDPDPYSNRFDLGKDPVAFAKRQAALVKSLIPRITERLVEDGEDYSQARRAFNVLLAEHGRTLFFAARFIGGVDVSRSHKGDENATPPLRPIDADKQREALALLGEQVFSDQPYQIPTELYQFLAPSHWSHWGRARNTQTDFPVHQVIESWQLRVLRQLLSSVTLERLHDNELKLDGGTDAMTVAELIETLTKQVFTELDRPADGEFSNRKPAVSSLRRNLQRNYLKLLARLAMGETSAPQDCETIAFMQLNRLADQLESAADRPGIDAYTRAHYTASAQRVRKVLDASLTLYSP